MQSNRNSCVEEETPQQSGAHRSTMCDVGAVVRPRNRPLLGGPQIAVARNVVELLKRLSRPRSDGLQSEAAETGRSQVPVMPPP